MSEVELEEKEEDKKKKKKKTKRNEFIDYEAELSDDNVEVSEDESSGDDEDDIDLVDKDAPELDSDGEEEVRALYHKQLESDDKRAVLILQEQLEEKEVAVGQQRRRRFRWQTVDALSSLQRHYDPDDDDSQDCDDEDDVDYDHLTPRLRRPIAETLATDSSRVIRIQSDEASNSNTPFIAACINEDTTNSQFPIPSTSSRTATSAVGMNKFVYRDKELVNALSTKEVIGNSREERDRLVQREFKKVLQSKSVFDSLYS